MSIDRLLGDREAETEAALTGVEAHEGCERPLDLAGRQPTASIFDLEDRSAVRDPTPKLDDAPDARVLDRVSDEVAECGLDESNVELDALIPLHRREHPDALGI